jgi:hypothetical protein
MDRKDVGALLMVPAGLALLICAFAGVLWTLWNMDRPEVAVPAVGVVGIAGLAGLLMQLPGKRRKK